MVNLWWGNTSLRVVLNKFLLKVWSMLFTRFLERGPRILSFSYFSSCWFFSIRLLMSRHRDLYSISVIETLVTLFVCFFAFKPKLRPPKLLTLPEAWLFFFIYAPPYLLMDIVLIFFKEPFLPFSCLLRSLSASLSALILSSCILYPSARISWFPIIL